MPEPVKYSPFLFYIKNNSIMKYYVANGEIGVMSDLLEGPILNSIYKLEYRPHDMLSADWQFLVLREVKSHCYVSFIKLTGGESECLQYTGVASVLLGELKQMANNYLALSESRTSLTLYSTTSEQT